MLDFLEADWNFCMKRSKIDIGGEAVLQESLLWHYIVGSSATANRGTRRRIVKAILATATPESLKDYPEIWEKETKRQHQKQNDNKKLEKVDFENGQLADYDDDEEMHDAPDDGTDGHSSDLSDVDEADASIDNLSHAVRQLGGVGAIQLRHRLIALVNS